MKIIDLLNKIANDEEVPKKIRVHYRVFEKYLNHNAYLNTEDEENYKYLTDLPRLFDDDRDWLNDEVEIIEEETKPLTKQDVEALGYACGEIQKCFTNGWNKSLESKSFKEDKKIEKIKYYDDSIAWVIDGAGQLSDIDKIAIDKINEIIDYLMENKK